MRVQLQFFRRFRLPTWTKSWIWITVVWAYIRNLMDWDCIVIFNSRKFTVFSATNLFCQKQNREAFHLIFFSRHFEKKRKNVKENILHCLPCEHGAPVGSSRWWCGLWRHVVIAKNGKWWCFAVLNWKFSSCTWTR